MSSAKHSRYGSHGNKHTKTPNEERRNGKAWKRRSCCGENHKPNLPQKIIRRPGEDSVIIEAEFYCRPKKRTAAQKLAANASYGKR